MATVKFPEPLYDRLRTGNCVLCTGVRFAALGGLPDWDLLLGRMSAKVGSDEALTTLMQERKFLTVAGHLKRKLGAESCATMLQEAYGKSGELTVAHKLLREMPFRAAISTGYDTLVEKALQKNGGPKVFTYADGAVLRLSEDLGHYVVKAHGDVVHQATMVLDRLDYKRVISPNQAYRAFIEDLYRTHTLLIVGYRPTDPDFELFLERLLASFRDAVTDHYAILPGLSQPEQEELYANYRVRVIGFDEGDDAAASLTKVLEQLAEGWRSRRTDTMRALDDPAQKLEWLRGKLAAVPVRMDVASAEGLELTEARQDAIRSAAESLKLDTLDAETLCRLGNVLTALGDVNRAVECYRTAVQKSPKMAEAHLNLHHALAEVKKYAESLEHLRQAIQLDASLRQIPARYEVTAVIGRGTTGTIYLGRDSEKLRDVTLKVLRGSFVREHVSPERWLKETEALRKLEHPNLARVYDAVVEGGRCILVTESLSGRSLNSLLRESGPLPLEKTVEILGQACQGLIHAHQAGVLHLDLTPSNIFLRDSGGAVLMDFRTGRARKGTYVTERGNEGFQAPELLAGVGGDARTDVYSLGAMLYTMLTGKLPIGSFHRLAEVVPNARRYDHLVTRALRAAPDERPHSVEDFAKMLASSSEELTLPEREDDLEGWLEVLGYQPDHARARDIISKLETSYRAEKSWDSLVALLLGRVEFEPEAGVREKLLREVAQIFEREVGDLGKAFAALQAAFRENSADAEIRKELERLAGATGLWNELLQEYTQLVQNLRDPKVACDWWVRMGRLYSHELGHDDYALASFNQALTLDGSRVDALNELTEVLKRKGLHKDYARTLTRLAELEIDKLRKVELYKDLARTQLRELGNDEEAVAAYRQVLELDPQNAIAAAALEGLFRKTEAWNDLATLLRGRIDVTEMAEDQKAYRRSLAEVLSEKLNLPDEAIVQYQKLMEADPDDVGALKALERLYDITHRNEDYLKILDKRIAAAQTVDEKVTLCRRMASEWEGQEGGKAKAAEYLEKIVQLKGADEETSKALVRLYWATGEHKKLVDSYQRQVKASQSPTDRAGLYGALGKVYEEHLKDDLKAIEAYRNLLDVEADSKIGLTALSRLYQKVSNWPEAVQMLQALSTREESVDKQVEIFHRIGALQLEQLRRPEEAEAALVKALELKDNHVESLLALGELYRARKDFGKAARMLREAGQATANAIEKVKRLHLAGVTYLDSLGDAAKAREVLEELLVADPEHVPSCERLAAIYEKAGEHGNAQKMLEVLVRKADTRDRARLIELNLRLARAALASENQERALAAYRTAYDLDPTHQPVLRELADLLYKRGEHDESGKLFQALLVHRRDSLAQPEIVEVFSKLGDIKERLGEKPKALNMYEKALDLEPNNAQVLEHVIRLYQEKGDLESVLRARKALLKGTTEEEARLHLLEEIGDLLREKMNRPTEAMTFYKQVVEARPDQRRVLNKIMEVYIEQKKWEDAVAAMGKIEDYETDANHRARLHYTAAVIYRDELHKPDEAAWHFDQALLKDPTHRKAFDSLKVLYTKQQNWKGLAKAFRLMLQRLPEDTPREEQTQLWHELGEICQDKLQDIKEAIIAYEVAAKLDPTDEARQDTLALLYTSAGPDAYEKAIRAHQRLLKNNPNRLETYKELRRLYGEMKLRDREWCVAAVLALLKKASDEEMALYKRHRSEKPRRASRKLSDDLWKNHVYHGWQDAALTEAFAIVGPIVAPMAAKPARDWGLRPAERLNLSDDTRPYLAAFKTAGLVLDRQPKEAYVRGDLKEPAGLLLAGEPQNAQPVLCVSPMLLDNTSEIELTYWMASKLALLRPEFMLRFATPSVTVLRAVALACLKLLQPEVRLGGDVGEILRLAEVLRKGIPPARFDGLVEKAAQLREASSEQNIERWMRAVDLSVSRAALLLCDDLETAARLQTATSDAAGAGGLKPMERVRELMLFSVSDPYFELREQMGLKIKG
jgi:golgin subfamily B member 1